MPPSHPPSVDIEALTRALMAARADVYGGGMFCPPETTPDDLPVHRLLTALEEATGTPRPTSEGEGAGSITAPPELSPELIETFVSAARIGEFVVHNIASYLCTFDRLRVTPDGVNHFLRAERAVIADIDLAARQPVPSSGRLHQLALRLTVDPRTASDPERYTLALVDDRPVVRRYALPRGERPALATPEESIRQYTLPAEIVLRELLSPRFDHRRLAARTERLFGRPVTAADGTAAVLDANRLVEYEIAGERVRVWVVGREVAGVDCVDCQRVLLYFCRYPTRRVDGPALKVACGARNPSRGVKDLMKALRAAGAGDWFAQRPYRWEDGVVVRPRVAG